MDHQRSLAPPIRPGPSPPPSTHDPSLFINRELSWLDFDERVLEEACDSSNPLLEQVRFLAISTSNLDEFFEVRVAGLQAQLYDSLEPQDMPPDGLSALAQVTEISRRAHDFVARQYLTWQDDLRPKLAQHGIVVCEPDELTEEQQTYLDDYFDSQVYPVLTPLAIDPAHPFPHLHNKSLNLILRIETLGQEPPRQLYAVLAGARRPEPGRPAARPRRRPAPLRPPGIRDRPPARRPLRRLQGGRVRRLPGDPEQRPDDPGDRGQEQPPVDRPGNPPDAEVGGRGPPGDRLQGRRRLPGAAPVRPGARPRRPRRLQGRRAGRPDRPGRPGADRRVPRTQRAPLRAADARRPGQRRGYLRRDPRAGPARPPPLRVVRVGHPVHRAGRRRPLRPGDQADPLPDRRGQPDHHRARPRRRERQAGDGPGRAASPPRRGKQHRQGPGLAEGRGPRRLRDGRPEDALQGRARRPARQGRDPPLRPPRDRQLQPDHRARSTPT